MSNQSHFTTISPFPFLFSLGAMHEKEDEKEDEEGRRAMIQTS